ncbi:hypothetical protein EG888_05520 [Listeria monocytogenes]|jgi:hypothetical protein|uniref:Uncharacterized protein n=1 Tax=Listeria monocytogenes TaxID=1639 RepID=A0A605VP48_LISMN|nr:hypothetical protein [Listeria monocytogenes]AEO24937.1 gp29 protein [Listeria monocytogenes FSL R2-561]EAD5035148.1 hypothetical protein [Listeria monocytogenes serotype 1/2a]EAE3702476.1 hypothetical protein [Listeria monocytogenes serotype 1/2c]EAF4572641.1 hypothetical protein [Listeria monocytogenes serotype 4b]EAG6270572.1 hypothetical protein [Listeria monocytogenes CFSAN003726]EAG6273182.1 hypothetical protein [Listeria monocytogenes CFSAN003808]EAG6279996.1 hypothetical protein [
MRGTRWFYIRALIVTIIAIPSLFIWDTRTVILFIFLYFVIQEVIFFIIDKKDHNKNDKLS